jgi:hypothetical protein
MTARRRLATTLMRALGLMLGPVLASGLAACTGGEASADGTAWITNKTGRDGLRIYVLDGAGRPWMDGDVDPYFRFDTQFTDRKRQCLVADDGSFEVRDPTGNVLVQHDFADKPVYERDELEVTDDLKIVWLK